MKLNRNSKMEKKSYYTKIRSTTSQWASPSSKWEYSLSSRSDLRIIDFTLVNPNLFFEISSLFNCDEATLLRNDWYRSAFSMFFMSSHGNSVAEKWKKLNL